MFHGKREDPKTTWDKATHFIANFRVYNFQQEVMILKPMGDSSWKKPPEGWKKINCYTAWSDGFAGMGMIIQDSDGFVPGGTVGYKENMACGEWAEAAAFHIGVEWVLNNNEDCCIF